MKALLYDAQEKDKREHKAIEEQEWQRARKDSQTVKAVIASDVVATLLSDAQ